MIKKHQAHHNKTKKILWSELWFTCRNIYWQKKKCTSGSTGNSITMKTIQTNCLVWIKLAICQESSFAKQTFIVAFCSVQQTIKCSKVNNGCDKPCSSGTTRHLQGMNGLRWVILACGMSSQTSWITRYNCTMVSGGGLRDLIWQSMRSLTDDWWGTGWWVRWPGQCMDYIWSTEVLWPINFLSEEILIHWINCY